MKPSASRFGCAGIVNSMEPLLRVAGTIGIEHLYHYDKFDRDRIADILTEHRIFCSNPSGFNDPWDCRPYFDPDLIMDAETHAAEAEHLIAGQLGGPTGNAYDVALRKSPFLLKSLIKDFSKRFNEIIPEKWGVYCLAKSACDTLMWSHYSRDHTGICLEFATLNSKFYWAYEVEYKESYPPFLLHMQTSRPTILISKSDVWAYEEEFRLICPRKTIYANYPLLMEGNYLHIGSTDLKSIIVGCQASDETAACVRQILAELAPHVRMKRASARQISTGWNLWTMGLPDHSGDGPNVRRRSSKIFGLRLSCRQAMTTVSPSVTYETTNEIWLHGLCGSARTQ